MPVVRSFHIFLFVITLLEPKFVIIDNSKVEDDIETIYGSLPLLVLFANFIPHRLEMSWRIINNCVDCGVFTMSHMETCMGGSLKEFKARFKHKSLAQDQ
uniref:Uncharacterized protein n=1 Tax=Lactuca sativa TaxID=4236 RepID=A0A9R1VXI6_LACSA|nr:hypothetical protein LSAT_V11C400223480 [Lactuca sativa]